mmetsp:Transcript_39764/g.131591  ORF Transcript_39764/g.131591 Transcript_39764/m.131591 type:complete len:254 (+) Transcript_39764:224-985(+)
MQSKKTRVLARRAAAMLAHRVEQSRPQLEAAAARCSPTRCTSRARGDGSLREADRPGRAAQHDVALEAPVLGVARPAVRRGTGEAACEVQAGLVGDGGDGELAAQADLLSEVAHDPGLLVRVQGAAADGDEARGGGRARGGSCGGLSALADAAAGVVHLEGRAPPVAARHHPLRVWRRRVHRRRARGRRPVHSLNPLAHDAQVALAIQRPFEGVEDSRHLERHLAAFRQDAVEQRLHRLDVGRRQADDRRLQR